MKIPLCVCVCVCVCASVCACLCVCKVMGERRGVGREGGANAGV